VRTARRIRRTKIRTCSRAAFDVAEISSDTDKCFPLVSVGLWPQGRPVEAAEYPARRVGRASDESLPEARGAVRASIQPAELARLLAAASNSSKTDGLKFTLMKR
jgi:hypothetical protein